MKPLITLLVLLFLVSYATGEHGTDTNPENARRFLRNFDSRLKDAAKVYSLKVWNYYTDMRPETVQAYTEARAAFNDVAKQLAHEIRAFKFSAMDSGLQRELKQALAETRWGLLDESKTRELAQLKTQMMALRSSQREGILISNPRTPQELLNNWKYFYENGRKVKPLYPRYVELNNENAVLQGYQDYGDMWRAQYDQENLEDEVFRLHHYIANNYRGLHKFVKYQLMKIYPKELFPKSGHIPEHLLDGSMQHVFELVKPHKHQKLINITQKMIERRYTVKRMYDEANNFYKSMGFPGMPPHVWNNSKMEYPTDGRKMVCHPMAYNLYNGDDFRLSMCADVDQYYMKAIYHEMGHLVYFQQYKHRRLFEMASANEAFHEAMGNIMGMSFESPISLARLKFIAHKRANDEITELFYKAMGTYTLILDTMILDLFRWGIFAGRITPENYNKEWWRLQCKYKGISPPTNRSREDFDAGEIYHVAADFSYIRYFFGTFIEYQLYRQACNRKGHRGPLYMCDISGSPAVGQRFRKLMEAGRSRPWQDLLYEFTEIDRRVEGHPIDEYFLTLTINLGSTWYPDNIPNLNGWKDECDPYPVVE